MFTPVKTSWSRISRFDRLPSESTWLDDRFLIPVSTLSAVGKKAFSKNSTVFFGLVSAGLKPLLVISLHNTRHMVVGHDLISIYSDSFKETQELSFLSQLLAFVLASQLGLLSPFVSNEETTNNTSVFCFTTSIWSVQANGSSRIRKFFRPRFQALRIAWRNDDFKGILPCIWVAADHQHGWEPRFHRKSILVRLISIVLRTDIVSWLMPCSCV